MKILKSAQQSLQRALRWSERYTKTDMVYLASGGGLSLLGQGASVIASLALAVAVSHFVSKESYGIYKYALSIITILSMFSMNSLGSAVFQSAAQGLDGAIKKAFWENIRWSAFIFVATIVLAVYYFASGNAVIAASILIGGLFSPFLASASLFGSFLAGKKDFLRLVTYGILDNIVPIFIFVGVIFFTQNPVILVATYFITNTIAALYFYRRTIDVYRANMHRQDDTLPSYSKHLSVMGLVSGIATNIDQILLFHFVGAAQLAIYNFATAMPDLLKGPVKNIDNMLQARFVSRSGAEIKSSMNNKLLWYLAFAIGATVIYIVLAPFIFSLLFPAYSDAIRYSQLYMLWIIPVALDPLTSYFAAKKLIFEQYATYFTYSVFQILALVIGVIFWGMLGVIIARLLTRVVVSTVNYFLYRRAIEKEIAVEKQSFIQSVQ